MADIAARQHGLISATQLREEGYSDHQRRHLVASGALKRLRRSVYSMAGAPPSWQQAALSAVLAAGPDAVLSHASAAAVWQLRHHEHARRAAPGIHLTAGRRLHLAGVRDHRRRLPESTRRVHEGVPVTSPEQTIIDLAATLSATQLGECIDDALRRGLVRLSRLHHLVGQLVGPGRRRIICLRQAVVDRAIGYRPGDSDWERRMHRQWDQSGLPAAVPNFRVHTNGRTYLIDLAIPELKIGVEWNGYHSHGTRSAFDRDSDRRADLTAAGWLMLDFTTRSSWHRIRRSVSAAIQQRQATGPPEGALSEAESGR